MRVVLVDDHAAFREGMKALFATTQDLDVCAEAGSAGEALAVVQTHGPELVLMDVVLPGMDGIQATAELRRRDAATRVLMLSAYARQAEVRAAFAAGANGYALKSEPLDDLVHAARTVGAGGAYTATGVGDAVARLESRGKEDPLGALSARERDVFRLAIGGLLNREIARELCISPRTVETHRYRIQRKLGLRNAVDFVRFAAEHGLLRARDPAE